MSRQREPEKKGLKPCPFCGGPARLVGGCDGYFRVICEGKVEDCPAHSTSPVLDTWKPGDGTLAGWKAKALWNRRAPSAEAVKPKEFSESELGETCPHGAVKSNRWKCPDCLPSPEAVKPCLTACSGALHETGCQNGVPAKAEHGDAHGITSVNQAKAEPNKAGPCVLGEPMPHGPHLYRTCATHKTFMFDCDKKREGGNISDGCECREGVLCKKHEGITLKYNPAHDGE